MREYAAEHVAAAMTALALLTIRNVSSLGGVLAVILSVYAVHKANRAENIALGNLKADVSKARKQLGDTELAPGG